MKRILVASILVMTASTAARADVLGQGGVRAGVIRDLDADRVSGVGVAVYGDIRGIGMIVGIDYQNVFMRVGENGAIAGHSLGLSFGVRFSPISFADNERALRYFDAYASAVADGGLVVRNGRTDRGSRKSSYVSLGVELRTGKRRIPAIVLEHQWRQRGDEYSVGNTLLIGVALVGSGRGPLRD